jgi:RNA polymerase sigma factor (sigma-70 family)
MASARLVGLLRYVRALAGTTGGDRSDADLLGQFVARRDEGAFAALLGRHGPLVLGVCRRVLGDEQDAEDAFQATFLVLARRAASIRRRESLAAWLHRVAFNIASTARLGTARRALERQAARMSRPSPPDEVGLRDWRPVLHEEVGRLPEKYRRPVVLCYFEGKTHDEASRQLGWALGTVKGRLARPWKTSAPLPWGSARYRAITTASGDQPTMRISSCRPAPNRCPRSPGASVRPFASIPN